MISKSSSAAERSLNYLKFWFLWLLGLSINTNQGLCNGNGVYFQYNASICLGQPVEFQCTVNGSGGINILTWNIYRSDGTKLGTDISYLDVSLQDSDTLGMFTLEQLSQSPLISSVSFTVQSSINGYTIVCKNFVLSSNKTFLIKVPDDSPGNVIIHTDTFTNSSVNISWTESPPYCGTTYRYNVSSTAPGWVNIIMESTSNSVTVPEGLVPSDDQYCVVVTAIEQYSTRDSNQSCFLMTGPMSVTNLTVNVTALDFFETNVLVKWNMFQKMEEKNLAMPDLIGYQVDLFNTTGIADDIEYHSPLLLPWIMNYTFNNVPTDRIYRITVSVINGVGRSLNNITIAIPAGSSLFTKSSPGSMLYPFISLTSLALSTIMILPTNSRSSSIVTFPNTPMTIKASPTLIASKNDYEASSIAILNGTINCRLPSSAMVVGISVAITVPVTAVITAIITVIILYLCGYSRVKVMTPPKAPAFDMVANSAYGEISTRGVNSIATRCKQPTLY